MSGATSGATSGEKSLPFLLMTLGVAAITGYGAYLLITYVRVKQYEAESYDIKRAFSAPPDLKKWSGNPVSEENQSRHVEKW